MVHVTLTNRQRAIGLERADLEKTFAELADALCENLRQNSSKLVSKTKANALAKRAQVSIVLVSNRTIRRLNKGWRQKDAATDVLSFPLLTDEPPAEMPWELGEIFISTEKALEQADTHNHSFRREIAFLAVHGMLHLLGFDHEESADEREMFERQEAILTAAGYPRI